MNGAPQPIFLNRTGNSGMVGGKALPKVTISAFGHSQGVSICATWLHQGAGAPTARSTEKWRVADCLQADSGRPRPHARGHWPRAIRSLVSPPDREAPALSLITVW